MFLVASIAAALIITPGQDATAQSPEMPLPIAVVKDADGKPIAQLLGFDDGWPLVLLQLGGRAHPLTVHLEQGTFGGRQVWFGGENCTGDPYILESTLSMIEKQNGAVVIAGPDATDGTYRGVFRSTSTTTVTFYITGSRWYQYDDGRFGECLNVSGISKTFYPAEEIVLNPMEGFHGPTAANPERVLTIEGGTRLP